MVDHQKKYIHVPIPKTASQTIHAALDMGGVLLPEPALYHNTLEHFVSEEYPVNKNYFKFSIVRNPWDRLASLWRDFNNRGNRYSFLHTLKRPLLSEFKSFEDLCLNLKNSLWSQNVFFKPQVHFVSYAGIIGTDYIGKFENLYQSYRHICEHINIAPLNKLPHINSTPKSNTYHDQYNEQTAEAIYNFYKIDIKTFNYKF